MQDEYAVQLTWPNSVLFKREFLVCVPWRRAIASEPGRSSGLEAQALVRVNSLGCRAQSSYGFSTVRGDHGHAEIRVYTGLRLQVARPRILSISFSRFQARFYSHLPVSFQIQSPCIFHGLVQGLFRHTVIPN